MDKRYFKLWHSWIEGTIFKDPYLWKLFCWCWDRTTHKDKWVLMRVGKGSTSVLLKRGEFIFGRHSAARALDMPPRSVERRMKRLVTMGILTIKAGSHYSIVTMQNYDRHQGKKPDDRAADGPTKGQPKGTIYMEESEELEE